MSTIRFFLLAGLFLFGGCAVTHYDSLDQKPQTDILVSSNVSAQIWINGQKIQEKAKEHLLKQAGMDIITLKAEGYHEARVIVYRSLPEKKNVSSHQSSVSWTTRKGADISSDLSDLGADAATTSPTSTVMLPVNLVKFVLNIAVMPFSFTTDFNPFGYYLAYDKNQFYVEMMPLSASDLSVFDAFKMQVKVFVLKSYPELAKGNPEYIAALSRFSGITQDDIKTVLSGALTPAGAADAIAEKMTTVYGGRTSI